MTMSAGQAQSKCRSQNEIISNEKPPRAQRANGYFIIQLFGATVGAPSKAQACRLLGTPVDTARGDCQKSPPARLRRRTTSKFEQRHAETAEASLFRRDSRSSACGD